MLYSIFHSLEWRVKSLLNFWLPNWHSLANQRVVLGKNIRYNQHTIISGKGKVKIGDFSSFGYKPGGFHRGGSIEIQARTAKATVKIGKKVATNNNIFICSSNRIEIGDESLIGQGVTIMDFEAHGISPDERRMVGQIGKVKVGNNVWIGNNVIVLKNTVIGDNSIVAAGAVVSGTFPDKVVIGGVPAKIIKYI